MMTHKIKPHQSRPPIGQVVSGPTMTAEAALAELLNARVEFNEYALRNPPALAVHLQVHDGAPVTVEQAARMMAFGGKLELTLNTSTLLISGQLAGLVRLNGGPGTQPSGCPHHLGRKAVPSWLACAGSKGTAKVSGLRPWWVS